MFIYRVPVYVFDESEIATILVEDDDNCRPCEDLHFPKDCRTNQILLRARGRGLRLLGQFARNRKRNVPTRPGAVTLHFGHRRLCAEGKSTVYFWTLHCEGLTPVTTRGRCARRF